MRWIQSHPQRLSCRPIPDQALPFPHPPAAQARWTCWPCRHPARCPSCSLPTAPAATRPAPAVRPTLVLARLPAAPPCTARRDTTAAPALCPLSARCTPGSRAQGSCLSQVRGRAEPQEMPARGPPRPPCHIPPSPRRAPSRRSWRGRRYRRSCCTAWGRGRDAAAGCPDQGEPPQLTAAATAPA